MSLLTIGMATYNDFDGVYFSIQALRLYQDVDDVELVVVDNYGCKATEEFLKRVPTARYVLAMDVTGTSAPRDRVFHEASGDFVLCMDSHVLLAPRAVERFSAYARQHPLSDDLLQGPLWRDELEADGVASHFNLTWTKGMLGQWASDERAADMSADPFEISNQGLGVFACRRAAWPGFNPHFAGFGGEEGYLQEKFRQRGARTLCLPFLRWVHRFARPAGVPYPLRQEDKVRNHLIGHAELGLDLRPILFHFGLMMTSEELEPLVREGIAIGNPGTSLYDVDALMDDLNAYRTFMYKVRKVDSEPLR